MGSLPLNNKEGLSLVFKVCIGLAVLISLAGCATPLSNESLRNLAWQTVAMDKCYVQDHIDATTAAKGKQAIAVGLSRASYNRGDYNRHIQTAQDKLAVSPAECKRVALLAHEYAAQELQQQATYYPEPQSYWPQSTQTICNNIAGQVLCSSY